MMSVRWLLMSLTAGIAIASGCARTPRPAEPPPVAGPDKAQQLRDRYTRIDPNVRVGVVSDVLPEHRLAAVSDVPVADFQVGQSISFIDDNGQTIVIGQIVRITGEALHVKYREPAADRRAPQVGDIAVRVR